MLIGIPESWQSALNDASEPQLRPAAVEFRHAAENMIRGAPDVLTTDDGLADGLVALAQLAQTATATGLRMFCWISM